MAANVKIKILEEIRTDVQKLFETTEKLGPETMLVSKINKSLDMLLRMDDDKPIEKLAKNVTARK